MCCEQYSVSTFTVTYLFDLGYLLYMPRKENPVCFGATQTEMLPVIRSDAVGITCGHSFTNAVNTIQSTFLLWRKNCKYTAVFSRLFSTPHDCFHWK